MRIKAVIFDFDGVILDSSRVAFKILEKVGKKLNLNLEIENRTYWGLSGLRTLERFFPSISQKEIKRIYKRWAGTESKLSIPLFPHALKVVSSLKEKGIITGLLTNRSAYWIKFYGERFGIDYQNLFDFIQTREKKSWFFKRLFGRKIHPNHFISRISKPNVDAFDPSLGFLKKKRIKPEEILYVGDTVMDSIASWLAGTKFAAIIGHGPLERKDFEKWPAKTVLDSIKELPELLEKIS